MGAAQPLSLERAAIERALRGRRRYRYVRPRVQAEGTGWKVVCGNCSRSVDARGGEIDIAWVLRSGPGWSLYARDQAAARWVARAQGLPLARVLALLCEDPNREFWR